MVEVTGFEPTASRPPPKSGKPFAFVYSGFRCFLLGFTCSLALLNSLFPSTPHPSVVINVVKNASRPKPDHFFGRDGKRFQS